MTRIVTSSVLAVGVVLGVQASSARSEDVRSAIEAANRAFGAAVRKGDHLAVGELYSEDARVIPPGAEVVRGRAAITEFWKQGLAAGLSDAVLSTVDVESAGDVAYETGTARITNRDGQTSQARYLVVWKKEDGSWKLHRDIWNAAGD